MAGRWLDVQQAARELGLSTDAVRKRISRGTLASEEQDGHRVVWLDINGTEAGHQQSEDSELVEELRRHNEYLQGQVEAEREARLRADHIIARLSESNAELSRTVRELESAMPSKDAQNGGEEDTYTPTGEGPNTEPEDASNMSQTSVQRPWWRRIFGA